MRIFSLWPSKNYLGQHVSCAKRAGLLWNLSSNGSLSYLVEAQQGLDGYVIGTSGNKPAVRTSAWMTGTETITDVVDFTEGLGKGEGLQPPSR